MNGLILRQPHARIAGLIMALSGALWAAHREKCSSCSAVPKIFGYSLSKPGIAFYSLMIAATLSGFTYIPEIMHTAAYAHGLLVVHMILSKKICPACIMAAIGAVTAAQTF